MTSLDKSQLKQDIKNILLSWVIVGKFFETKLINREFKGSDAIQRDGFLNLYVTSVSFTLFIFSLSSTNMAFPSDKTIRAINNIKLIHPSSWILNDHGRFCYHGNIKKYSSLKKNLNRLQLKLIWKCGKNKKYLREECEKDGWIRKK